ncbi:MAG: VOC family protein [Methyloceanibacter sp.]
MYVNPYLTFDGDCEQAFKVYEKVLGGEIVAMMPHEGTPAETHVPAEWRKKILHARLVFGDNVLMASDAPPGRREKMQGFSVSLVTKDPAEAERIFNAFADGGTVIMPLGETFWALKFGMLRDRFGTPWMVNCEKAA